jgi:hypothetical protein
MKKIYFIIALLGTSLLSQAQLTLTKAVNEPVVGDIENLKFYDTVGVFPKNTGTGQLWNFSNMVSNTFTETTTYTTVASTPSPALFSNANLAINKGGSNWDFMKSNSSTLEYAGLILGSNDYVNFSNTGIAYSWPISYSSINTDTFTAIETTGTNTINWAGTISYTAAGSGTVILPGGSTFNNCLMLKTIINITMAGSTSTTQLVMINYDYYSAGLKFPVVHSQYQTSNTGTVVSKQTDFSISSTALTVGIAENKLSVTNLVAFPNPSDTELNLLLPNSIENFSVVLSDLNGKKIIEKTNAKTINVSNIEKGIYILSVNGKSINARKTVVITH